MGENKMISEAFTSILEVSLIGGVLSLLVTVLKKVFQNNIPPKAYLAMWLIVFLRLLVPFQFETEFTVPAFDLSKTSEISIQRSAGEDLPSSYSLEAQSLPLENKTQHSNLSTDLKGNTTIVSPDSNNEEGINKTSQNSKSGVGEMLKILTYIWLSGVIILLSAVSLLYVRVWTKVNKLKPCDLHYSIHLVEKCRKAVGIGNEIQTYVSDIFNSPCVFGIIRPKLILPRSFEIGQSDEDSENVILHELYHIKHKHNILNLLFLVAACIHWFNPLVWYALGSSREDVESVCDEAVVRRLPENKIENYGRTIIRFAAMSRRWVPVVVHTGLAGSKKGLKSRINNISCFGRRKFTWIVLSIIMTMMLGACGAVTTLKGSEGSKPSDNKYENNQSNSKFGLKKSPVISSNGFIHVYPEAQPMVLSATSQLDSSLEVEVIHKVKDWLLIEQGETRGFIPSWFIDSGKVRPMDYIDSIPMVLKKDTEGVLYPGGAKIVDLQSGKLLTPLMKWENWYHVSIIVYDIPAVQFAWIREEDLTTPDKFAPNEGYICEGAEVYYSDINGNKPEKLTGNISVYVSDEKSGYINIHAAGGWSAWTKKENLKLYIEGLNNSKTESTDIGITSEIGGYNPLMSSTPGIPLMTTMGKAPEGVKYHWSAEYGIFLSWENDKIEILGSSIENQGEKIFWAVDPETKIDVPEFKVYLSLESEDGTIVYSQASIKIRGGQDGFFIVNKTDDSGSSDVITTEKISEFSFNTGTGSLALQDWDNKVDFDKLLGKPVSEDLKELSNADTFTGSFIKTKKYDGLEVELLSPKGNGKTFYVLSMKVSGTKFSTSRGIRVGDDVELLKQSYPEIQRVLDGRTDDSDCAYQYWEPDKYSFLRFEIKNNKVINIHAYYELP